MKSFPFYPAYQNDCGPACLKMIASFYGKDVKLIKMDNILSIYMDGCSMLDLSDAAEQIGFKALAYQGRLGFLKTIHLPAILHWQTNHFIVLFKIEADKYHIADPARGLLEISDSELMDHWGIVHDGEQMAGYALTFNVSLPSVNK